MPKSSKSKGLAKASLDVNFLLGEKTCLSIEICWV